MQKFSGLEYLKIDIANHMGLDKLSYAERIAWVDEYEEDLEDLSDTADKPFLFIAAVMAYRDTQQGRPTGHLVGFDSCASGLQIMAALTGCKVTAKNTGLIGQERMDMYGECTKAMSRILGESVDVPRKQVKSAQMPHFYGSRAKPKEIFGDNTPEFHAFHKANEEVAPGACELLEVLLGSWQAFSLSHDWVLPDGFEAHCPVMVQEDKKIEVDELDHASFTYRLKVNKGTESGLSIAANPIHSIDGMVVREMCRRCNYDWSQLEEVASLIHSYLKGSPSSINANHRIDALAIDSGFVSLVGVEYVNKDNIHEFSVEYLERLLELCLNTMQHKSFPLITIHDEFKAHANHIQTVRQVYADIMAEIADSDMLEILLTDITGQHVPVTKYSTDLGQLIRESEYALS